MGAPARPADRDDSWSSVVYVVVGVASMWVFTSSQGPVNAGGVVASVGMVLYGLSTWLVSVFSNPLADASDGWTGCFWMLVGLGGIWLAMADPATWSVLINGFVIGIGAVLYGVFIALGR